MDEINVSMKGKSLRRIGIRVLVYGILCVGILGFIVAFGSALGLTYIYAAADIFVKTTIDIFNFLVGAGWMLGFVLLIIGGIALLFNKNWGKTISIIGIWFCFALAVGTIGLGFIFAMQPTAWRFDNGNFIFFVVIGGVILFFAVVILKRLKRLSSCLKD